ncbi:MAG: DNA cytosine methyltransferase [Pyrinomonadaceae bacterium]
MSPRILTAIDCFSGAGGLSIGFVDAGFDIRYAFDLDSTSIDTYRQNIGPHAEVSSIYDVSRLSMEKFLGETLGEIDVVFGGPPCQGFSVQRRGSDVDSRNDLVMEFARLVFDIRPRFFVMENVGGLLAPRGVDVMRELRAACESQGYYLHIKKLDASLYGVPQFRKRVFIVGERWESGLLRFTFPEPYVSNGNVTTVRDAIEDLTDRSEGDVPNHRSDKLSPINIERIRWVKEGQGRDSLPDHLQLNCHRTNSRHRHLDVYGRMSWDKPAPTITARFDSFSRGRFGHPVLDRTITLREGARLQTFKDDFIFQGTKTEVAKQIGNAVPPILARALAERIKNCI